MLQWLTTFYLALTTPPLTETESIIKVFRDNLPKDYSILRDTRILISISDQITDYTRILELSAKLLKYSKKTYNSIVETNEVLFCHFYSGDNEVQIITKTEQFIKAAEAFLIEYNAALHRKGDTDLINTQRLEVIYLNLKGFAIQLLEEQLRRENE